MQKHIAHNSIILIACIGQSIRDRERHQGNPCTQAKTFSYTSEMSENARKQTESQNVKPAQIHTAHDSENMQWYKDWTQRCRKDQ